MGKIFEYFNKTGEMYCKDGEYDGDIGYEVEYEVDYDDVYNALVDIVYKYYFKNIIADEKILKKSIEDFINNDNLWDILEENYKEELWYYFRDRARMDLGL